MRSVLRSSNASWWCAVSEPVKVAVAGAGYGSKVALPVYSELEEFQPVAVWSRRPERALELAEQAGLELGTSDLEELLRFPGLEAVRVATPVVTHPEFARAVVERGLHQLCEKPLADNLAAAREIAQAARRAGVVAAVNYGRRFEEGRRRLLERAVRCSEGRGWRRCPWCSPIMPTRTRVRSRGCTTRRWGRAARATASTTWTCCSSCSETWRRSVTAEDAFGILLPLRGGGLAVVSFTATARHDRGDLIEIYGAEGTVRLDPDGRLSWRRSEEELQVEGPLGSSPQEAFEHVARRFWAPIRSGAPPDPSLDEALRVQSVFDAVRTADVERLGAARASRRGGLIGRLRRSCPRPAVCSASAPPHAGARDLLDDRQKAVLVQRRSRGAHPVELVDGRELPDVVSGDGPPVDVAHGHQRDRGRAHDHSRQRDRCIDLPAQALLDTREEPDRLARPQIHLPVGDDIADEADCTADLPDIGATPGDITEKGSRRRERRQGRRPAASGAARPSPHA